MPYTAVTYTSAFFSSLCCGAPITRYCYEVGPDIYVCRKCGEGARQPGWDPRSPLRCPDGMMEAPPPRSVRPAP